MRDLNVVLKAFSNECNMNYCKDFDTVKSILDFVNANVKSFDKVQFRGGNEHVIDEICLRLRAFFMEKNYIDHREHTASIPEHYMDLRKIVMFLILNTDVTYKFNINKDKCLIHLLEICPQLSKFLLVSIIWELKLDKFYYEILSYTPCWFSFQHFEAAVSSLKHINEPYKVLEKVESLICSILTSITRTETRIVDKVDKKIILTKLYDYTMDLLRQFYTPDAEKFKQFSKTEFFKYSGYAIRHLLDMVLYGFDCYELKHLPKLEKNLEIYDNICTEISPKNPVKQEHPSNEVKEALLKIITSILNSLQYNVCLVSIDVFMYWVEVDIDDGTLQSIVGERSYLVLERMSKNIDFGHDIQAQLQSIAIRPKTFQEILQEATMCDILCKLEKESNINSSEKTRWLGELIARPISLGNDECLETIESNTKLITPENCKSIIDYMVLDLINQQDDDEDSMECENSNKQLVQIVLSSLQNFESNQIISLIEYEITKFGEQTDVFQLEGFNSRSIEFFNKFISSFDLQSFLCLCFENPHATWALFFEMACQSEQQIVNFCSAIKQTYKMSKTYLQDLMSSCFSNVISQEKFFTNLVCEIYFNMYLKNKSDFFKMVHSYVVEMIESECYESLKPIITILSLISNRANNGKCSNFGEVTAPVLVMAAQIMDRCRWDLINYTDIKEDIVRCTIEFVQSLSKKFLPVASDKDKKWISQSVKESYRPITQYYFQKFSLGIGVKIKAFDRFLIPMDISNSATAEVVLVIHFIRCTTKETEWLAKCDRFEAYITKMMSLLNNTVKEAEHPNAINNYRYCIINYKNIIKKVLMPKLEKDAEKIKNLFIDILGIIHVLPLEIYEEIFGGFESLLLEMLEEPSNPFDETMINVIRTSAQPLKDCNAKNVLTNKLDAMISTLK